MSSTFQSMLREHRRDRGLSQLDLALESGCSQRHISFLESGRSSPSRTMVLSIGEAMNIPSRQRNELLLAAGFAPAYAERALDDPELDTVREAFGRILQSHQPYPAFVFDWKHDIIAANPAAIQLQLFLFGVTRTEDLPELAGNIIRGLLHPDGYRLHIANWAEIASTMLRRFHAEVVESGMREQGLGLLEEFSSYEGIPKNWRQYTDGDWRRPMLTVDVDKDDIRLSLFSILSTLGAPFDITLQGVRIESFYPADEASKQFFD